jgi:hypothetical protein
LTNFRPVAPATSNLWNHPISILRSNCWSSLFGWQEISKTRVKSIASPRPFGHTSAMDQALDRITAIIRSLTSHLAQQPAIPCLDIADIRTGLLNGGRAYFGKGEAEGPDRAVKAADAALRDLKRVIREG